MENIMLQDARKEQIKIVDFGLSNIYDREDPLKTHCGSPEYAAPELFVVGKKYGPEVDLWSLGVVLYGMMTGRLPFLSPCDEQTSSDEHRRRLMAQINRGLTALQVKNMSRMSNDGRNLINRLLTPVPHKRITIQELCHHPWIACKLRNASRIGTEVDLDLTDHKAIIAEISKMTHLDRNTIEMEIIRRKYGEIGGMYNIKSHEARRAAALYARHGGSLAFLRYVPQHVKRSYSATSQGMRTTAGEASYKSTITTTTTTTTTTSTTTTTMPTTATKMVTYSRYSKPEKKSSPGSAAAPCRDGEKCWDGKSMSLAEVKNSGKLQKIWNTSCTVCKRVESRPSTNTRQKPQTCKKTEYSEHAILLHEYASDKSNEEKQTSKLVVRRTNIRSLPSSSRSSFSQASPVCPESNTVRRNPIKRWSEIREKRETIRQQRRSTHSVSQTDPSAITSTSSVIKTRPRTSESSALNGSVFNRSSKFPTEKIDSRKEIERTSMPVFVKKKIISAYDAIGSKHFSRASASNKSVPKISDKMR